MPAQMNLNEQWDEMLKSTVNTFVQPITNWAHAMSPVVYFGCNIDEKPVEQHVLNQVGSYGSQINRIIDAIEVLLSLMPVNPPHLNTLQLSAIKKFRQLAIDADKASASYQNQATRDFGWDEIDELASRLRQLSLTNPRVYESALKEVQKSLPAPDAANSAAAD